MGSPDDSDMEMRDPAACAISFTGGADSLRANSKWDRLTSTVCTSARGPPVTDTPRTLSSLWNTIEFPVCTARMRCGASPS